MLRNFDLTSKSRDSSSNRWNRALTSHLFATTTRGKKTSLTEDDAASMTLGTFRTLAPQNAFVSASEQKKNEHRICLYYVVLRQPVTFRLRSAFVRLYTFTNVITQFCESTAADAICKTVSPSDRWSVRRSEVSK